MSRNPMVILVVWACVAGCGACSPSSAEDVPANLVVLPEGLDFDDQADSRFLEVKNEGGGSLTFKVKIGAESGGVVWLAVEPDTGTLSGGSSKGLLASVVNRDQLLPGSYVGEVTVEAEGLESRKVTVTMIVGQPVLATDPGEQLDFGLSSDSRNLLVTNAGKGKLNYSLALPGPWLSSSDPLPKALAAGETATFVLSVDRDLVPWYGTNQGELVITSNGLTDATHSAVVTLAVAVTIDASCTGDGDCTKEGFYYCAKGQCVVKAAHGLACDSAFACKSGHCVGGICCDEACDGQCRTCLAPATLGKCTPLPPGTACDDGNLCTADDECGQGECAGGPPVDCSAFDVDPCSTGACDPQTGECDAVVAAAYCVIDEVCVPDGELHPEHPCQSCVGATLATGWTLADKYCLIDGQCLTTGQDTGEPCHLCNPKTPFSPSVAEDGAPCDDGNACTADLCQGGKCVSNALDDGVECDDGNGCSVASACVVGKCEAVGSLCDDGNPCTQDVCEDQQLCAHPAVQDGLDCPADAIDCTLDVCTAGVCAHPVKPGLCLVDGTCVAGGALLPGNDCLACAPDQSPLAWSPVGEGTPCDDGLFCTVDDVCSAGVCGGAPRTCPGDACHTPWCSNDLAKCGSDTLPDTTPCDDGAPCSLVDACAAGVCTGQKKDCAAAAGGNECAVGICDAGSTPVAGACVSVFKAQGTPCNDALACTLDESCNGQGQCGSGTPKTPASCAVELANQDPCLVGACSEAEGGCHLVPANEGMVCTMPGAFAQCLEGQCTLVACEDGFDDCAGAPGCETPVHYDPANCGQCDFTCDLADALDTCFLGACVVVECKEGHLDCDGIDETGCEVAVLDDAENCGECDHVCVVEVANKVGICVAGQCNEAACPEGAIDADGQPGNGCEIQALVFVDAAHVADPEQNGSAAHPYGTIQQGVDAAQPGFTVFVRNGNYTGPVAVDKKEVQVIGESRDGVFLDVGAQVAGVLITKSNVVVRKLTITGGRYGVHFKASLLSPVSGGEAAELTILDMSAPNGEGADAAGVFVELASNIVVKDVYIEGVTAGTGLELLASEVPAKAGDGGPAAGIGFDSASGGEVSGCTVKTVVGGTGGYSGTDEQSGFGGVGAGIRLVDSFDQSLTGNIIEGITGGAGGNKKGAGDWKCGEEPAALGGGLGAGVILQSCSGIQVVGNEVTSATGGTGGSSSNFCGGDGGLGAGFYLLDSSGNKFTDNTVTTVAGGKPGNGGSAKMDSLAQEGFGFYFEPDSLANDVALSNSHGGEPIVYRYGVQDETIEGLTLTAAVNPTNLGKLVVIDSVGVTVTGNQVGGFRGQVGYKGNGYTALLNKQGGPGGDGVGIRVEQCQSCQVVANEIAPIDGGAGGACVGENWGYMLGVCGAGGAAYGILGVLSPDLVVADNEISQITGGTGGHNGTYHATSGSIGGNGGTGGTACAIQALDTPNVDVTTNQIGAIKGGNGGLAVYASLFVGGGGTAIAIRVAGESVGTVAHNQIRDLAGGRAGFYYNSASDPLSYVPWGGSKNARYKPAGGATGIVIEGVEGLSVTHHTIGYLAAGQPYTGGTPESQCVRLADAKAVAVTNLTCFNVGLPALEVGHGIVSAEPVQAPAQVMDSVVAFVSGYGLKLADAAASVYLKADYTDFFQCGLGATNKATVQAHCLAVDPLFTNAAAGIDSLLPASPCIDAGNPASAYAAEPSPNGCRVNMGAYGNTPQATSAPAASHCE